MLFHASIFVSALVFWGLLEAIAATPIGSPAFSIVLLSGILWVSRRFGGTLVSAIIPTFFSLSTIVLLFFISSPHQRHIFIVLASIVFYVSILGIYRLRHYSKDSTARSMVALVSMTTLFFFFSALYGVFLNFRNFTEVALMISYGVGTFLVGLQVFSRFFPEQPKRFWFFALFLSLCAAEIGWVASFWPFGYLTAGVLVLILLSIPWDMITRFSSGSVSGRRVATSLAFLFFLLSMVLLSSVWLPVV